MRLDMQEILAAIERATPADDVDYRVIPELRYSSRVHFAVSRAGTPALLVLIEKADFEECRLTRGVCVRLFRALELREDDQKWTQSTVVIECRDRDLLRVFSAMACSLVKRIEALSELCWSSVLGEFEEWEKLLSRRKLLAGESELGLWGELWCLFRSARRHALLAAWRGPEGASMDFLVDGISVEVKTGLRRGVHSISQRQLDRPAGNASAFLMSIHTLPDPLRGRSLSDLVEALTRSVSDPAGFEEKLASVGYSRGDDAGYTRRLSVLSEPTFYDVRKIPRVRQADPGISHIRYQVELADDSALHDNEKEVPHSALGLDLSNCEYPCV